MSQDSPEKKVNVRSKKSGSPAKSTTGRKILLIDDDPHFCDILGQILRLAHYDVVCAVNGKEGMDLFRSSPADVVITDILMPEQEGFETICELRKGFPTTPIIAMSGGGVGMRFDVLQSARHLGAHYTISKPFGQAEILSLIEQALASPLHSKAKAD